MRIFQTAFGLTVYIINLLYLSRLKCQLNIVVQLHSLDGINQIVRYQPRADAITLHLSAVGRDEVTVTVLLTFLHFFVYRFAYICIKVEDEVLPALIIDVTQIAGVPVFKFEVFVHSLTLTWFI